MTICSFLARTIISLICSFISEFPMAALIRELLALLERVRSGDVPLYLVSWRGFIATYIEFGDDKAAAAATLYVAAETDAVTIFCAPSLT
ncbi:BnaA10g06940D [Brassica napus]|uniref:(rape) hypothetical protein n=1 Tax=Brassica napus TaxID=3708 RepID=A0A078FMN5_BRANA|nr:unnamed protein product [Brassica napus]CDY14361.1 BnaA10g06940D [Brassica napus]